MLSSVTFVTIKIKVFLGRRAETEMNKYRLGRYFFTSLTPKVIIIKCKYYKFNPDLP